jgi:hypothetical protein
MTECLSGTPYRDHLGVSGGIIAGRGEVVASSDPPTPENDDRSHWNLAEARGDVSLIESESHPADVGHDLLVGGRREC